MCQTLQHAEAMGRTFGFHTQNFYLTIIAQSWWNIWQYWVTDKEGTAYLGSIVKGKGRETVAAFYKNNVQERNSQETTV